MAIRVLLIEFLLQLECRLHFVGLCVRERVDRNSIPDAGLFKKCRPNLLWLLHRDLKMVRCSIKQTSSGAGSHLS